jgi:hypothetical protein
MYNETMTIDSQTMTFGDDQREKSVVEIGAVLSLSGLSPKRNAKCSDQYESNNGHTQQSPCSRLILE